VEKEKQRDANQRILKLNQQPFGGKKTPYWAATQTVSGETKKLSETPCPVARHGTAGKGDNWKSRVLGGGPRQMVYGFNYGWGKKEKGIVCVGIKAVGARGIKKIGGEIFRI